MNRTIRPRVIARGFLLLSLLVGAGCTRGTPDPHVLGHVSPRSGPDQAAGLRASAAVAMAVTEANESEALRIDARTISMIHGDTGPDTDGFAHQATRLLAVNRVAALIGGSNAAELDRLVPVVQAHQVVLVSPAGGTVGTPSKLAYCVGVEPKERGRILAKYAGEERKLTGVAVVVDANTPISIETAAAFTREFVTADRKVVNEVTVRNRNDLPDVAARLGKSKPPAVLYAGSARDFLTLRTGLQKAGVADATVMLFAGEEEADVLLREPEPGPGIVWTTAFTEEDPARAVQDFCTQFRTRTRESPDVTAALSYDAARILFDAARKAKTFRVADARKELKPEHDFDCLTGPFRFTAEQTARRTVYVMQMSDGKAKLAKTYPPEKR